MNKKIFSLIIVLFLVSVLFSCGGNASSRGKNLKRSVSESLAILSNDSTIWKSVSKSTEQNTGSSLQNQDSTKLQVDSSDYITLENNKLVVVFDKNGASVKSVLTKEWKENGKDLDLILKSNDTERAFQVYPGKNLLSPLKEKYDVQEVGENYVIFSHNYLVDGHEAKFTKKFTITNQYLISLETSLDFAGEEPEAINGSFAYTVDFGPALGPSITSNKKNQNNARNYYIYHKKGKKYKKDTLKFDGDIYSYNKDYKWAELTGKYFGLIVSPSVSDDWKISAFDNVQDRTQLFMSLKTSEGQAKLSYSGTLYTYLGPQLKTALKAFDYPEKNDLKLEGMSFAPALVTSGSLMWLQNILRWIMSLFYKIIPNWGVAIIFLTLLVKILLFPLYKKGVKSAQAMQKIAPKLEALKAEYKDQPEKLNVAMLDLYKKNKISPASSMLPMIIQLPVLLAMYGLIGNRFELREAVFIPRWITDLSSPDTVCQFPFNIPLLGNQLHVLPLIYFASMMLSMLYTQKTTPSGNTSKAMNRFMYLFMPIILFFSLYNVSSGLLLYWTVANILTIIQQIAMNKYFKSKEQKKERAENDRLANGPKLPPKAKNKHKK